eukprot:CAMPEP_0181541466 /NCGR_PEP_ID=MMETSP1110-20121109/77417_1 /TAXON_ID=174948 /ORGANISM="Symbiodinium sp., Strain CCMP421" /LENGTH=162 /DNA_ID=CAMNT_0023673141 /DNA_START=267 /DNA_END=752 /DNA_ORIENTATION=-
MLAFCKAFCVAGIGASSIITGSAAARANECILANGWTPSFASPRSLQISTAAAPSQICDEDAGVRTPFGNIAFSFATLSTVTPSRMPSSWVCMPSDWPSFRLTGRGTISSANLPACVDVTALCCSKAFIFSAYFSMVASLMGLPCPAFRPSMIEAPMGTCDM